jgi:hypothetical protein
LGNGGSALYRIRHGVQVNFILVCDVYEHVQRVNRLLPSLFYAENEVNPTMEVGAHVLTLKGLSIDTNEAMGIPFRPLWQRNVMNCLSSLGFAEIKVIRVHKEIW